MRQSVEAKRAAEQRQRHDANIKYKRIALWLLAVFCASLSLSILSYANWHADMQVKADTAKIANDQLETKKYIAIAKINAIKKVESTAIAAMEAQMAAQNATERSIAAATQTEPPTNTSCSVTDPSLITVIINKKHCFNPVDWAPADLTTVTTYPMRTIAAAQMTTMLKDAAAAGSAFTLTSGYRSYQDQKSVYMDWLQTKGSVVATDTISARPGYSEHQTGLAADLQAPGCVLECFATSSAYTWLTQHAADYGFINRYPAGLSAITGYAPEPWHWRYVGTDVAKDMKTKGIKTMELYYGVSGGTY